MLLVDLSRGVTAEIGLTGSWQAALSVRFRPATELELTRQDATEALLKAERGTKYSALNAALIRAKASHVEAALIARAGRVLSTLEVAKPCDLPTLRKKLRWRNVTEPGPGAAEVVAACCDRDGCTVGAPRDGEVCEIVAGAVQEAMQAHCSLAPKGGEAALDRWLFEQLSEAIILGFGAWSGNRFWIAAAWCC